MFGILEMGPELSQAPSLADVSLSDDHFQGVDIFSVRSLPIHQISVSVPFLPSLLTSLHELCVLPSPSSHKSFLPSLWEVFTQLSRLLLVLLLL